MGVADGLINHLLTEGSSMKLLPAVNLTLLCLIGLLLYMADGVLPVVHLNIMGGLSVVLLIAVNLFIREFKQEMTRQAAEGGSNKVNGSGNQSPEKAQKSD